MISFFMFTVIPKYNNKSDTMLFLNFVISTENCVF